tara:strand:- start:310 stop:591 length:282 start_codon:yes stop_codon:yes gene_type:complete
MIPVCKPYFGHEDGVYMSNEIANFLDVGSMKILEIAGESGAIRFLLYKADSTNAGNIGVFYLRPEDVRKFHDALDAAGSFCNSVVNCEVLGGG